MPRPVAPLPDGYAVTRQPDGFYLLRLVGNDLQDGKLTVTWEQIAGPYTQRINAVRMAIRDSKRRASSNQRQLE